LGVYIIIAIRIIMIIVILSKVAKHVLGLGFRKQIGLALETSNSS
jgi:hypothetical protein